MNIPRPFLRSCSYRVNALFFLTLLLVTSCRKDKPVDMQQLRQRNAWKVSLFDFDPTTNPEGSVYYSWSACQLDDKIVFGKEYVEVINTGACREEETGIFKLGVTPYSTEGKIIRLDTIELRVVSLTPGRLKLLVPIPSATGMGNLLLLLVESE